MQRLTSGGEKHAMQGLKCYDTWQSLHWQAHDRKHPLIGSDQSDVEQGLMCSMYVTVIQCTLQRLTSRGEKHARAQVLRYLTIIDTTWQALTKSHTPIEVNSMMLQMKALEFNKLLDGSDSFKAANGWLDRFLSRHGIRMAKIAGEQGQADLDAIYT